MKKLIAMALAIVCATSTAAMAHALLQSSKPPAGSSVAAGPAPVPVSLTFTEAIHVPSCTFRVCRCNDEAAATQLMKTLTPKAVVPGAVAASVAPASGDVESVTLSPGALGAGTYAVLWKVMAADDGHVTQGHFLFHVTGR